MCIHYKSICYDVSLPGRLVAKKIAEVIRIAVFLQKGAHGALACGYERSAATSLECQRLPFEIYSGLSGAKTKSEVTLEI